MKILHLLYESKGDYFGIGGVGTRAYEIYRYLKHRHEITLLCKRYPSSPLTKNIEGLRHIFVGSGSKSLTKSLLSYAYKAALFVKNHGDEFDIIIEDFSPAIPTFLNLYKKRPVILQIQGYTGKGYFKKYNILYSSVLFILEKVRSRFYRDIIVVSDATRKRFIFNRNSNIQIISNGIHDELINCERGCSDYILYLGRIDIHSKGLDILIDAYRDFYNFFPDIRLVVAGDGRDMKVFRKRVETLPANVRDNIEMTGWVEGRKKIDLFKDAVMVVIPSRYETQGIVVLEAMAHGKPVITSDIPELNYVVNCGAGMAFKAGIAESLYKAMKALINNNRKREEMGEKGREMVKDFTWEKVALRYEKFLQDVID